jgi:hypothetical protein
LLPGWAKQGATKINAKHKVVQINLIIRTSNISLPSNAHSYIRGSELAVAAKAQVAKSDCTLVVQHATVLILFRQRIAELLAIENRLPTMH